MALYSVSMNGVTLSTSADTRTLVTTTAGAGSSVYVYELFMAGEAGSAAVVRFAVNRPSAVGITSSGPQTPVVLNPSSPAAGSTWATGWTTQPTLSTNDVILPTFNAFGGIVRWVAPPDSQIVTGNSLAGAAANLSFRSRSGTSVISGHILFEEK